MATVVEIILKGTDKASKAFKEVGKSSKGMKLDFDKLGKAALAGGASLIALGVAGKQAFEFGKQGAEITQTADSFDMLMDKVGAVPGVLEDLRDASRGTITDFELMSSTATLLAGASGELATELANSTPRLMEIAKAANKLNPALGDTAFMYNSIATGVKRAQPLILDNLGLTIKVGEANEAMAKSLGKSVDELTAQEKSLAILNATLEAGDTLIDQVGGSTESAADAFFQLETMVKNFVDALKQDFAPAITEFVTDAIELWKAHALLNDAFELGIIDQKEYNRAIIDVTLSTSAAKRAIEEWAPLVEDAAGYSEHAAQSAEDHAWAVERQVRMADRSTTAWAGYNDVMRGTGVVVEELAETTEEATERINEAAAQAIADFQKTLSQPTDIELDLRIADIGISGDISGFIDELLYVEAGGDEVGRAVRQIKQAILDEKITSEEGREFLGEAFIIDQQTLVDANQQSAKEAAENIAEEFGISFNEAVAAMGDVESIENLLSGVEALKNIPEKLAERTQMLELAEGISLTGINAGEAYPMIDELAGSSEQLATDAGEATGKTWGLVSAIGALESKDITISVTFETHGEIPSFGGGGGNAYEFKQHGGPVSAGGAYVVGEAGPELFVPGSSGSVVPNDKMGGAFVQIINYNQSAAAAAMAYDEAINMAYMEQNEAMGV